MTRCVNFTFQASISLASNILLGILCIALSITNTSAETFNASSSSELISILSSANPGDHITLTPGNYGGVKIEDINFSNYVFIESEVHGGAVFTNFKIEDTRYLHISNIKIEQASGTHYGFHVVRSDYITLEDSIIYGADFMVGKNIYLNTTESVKILSNEISTTNDGIHTGGKLINAIFDGNSIITRKQFVRSGAHDDSIQLRSGPIQNLTISRNLLVGSDQNIFHQNIGSAPWENIVISGNVSIQNGTDFAGKHVALGDFHNVTVEGNTFVTQGGGYAHGVNIKASGSYIVKGNIFWDSLYMSKASGNNSDYNLFYDTTSKQVLSGYNSFAAYRSAQPTNDVHSIEGNPMFVDIAHNNARLLSASPAINTGTALNTLSVDMDGHSRPADGQWDIGAHEYGSGPTTHNHTPKAPSHLRTY